VLGVTWIRCVGLAGLCTPTVSDSACYLRHDHFFLGLFFEMKCRLTVDGLRGVISYNIEIFTAISVKT
jgi:hypothetical protein